MLGIPPPCRLIALLLRGSVSCSTASAQAQARTFAPIRSRLRTRASPSDTTRKKLPSVNLSHADDGNGTRRIDAGTDIIGNISREIGRAVCGLTTKYRPYESLQPYESLHRLRVAEL